MDASKTSDTYTCISDDVISKVRSFLVYNGVLEETVLSELLANWKRKMIQAGVVNGTIERSPPSISTHTPLQPQDPNPLLAGFADINAQDLEMSVRNERDGFYIPQHDGASDGDIVAEPNAYAPYYDDDEILNEDDDDEEDGIDDDEDIQHFVMCQFDYVKKRKNKWECKLKAGVMQINDKNILFSEAKGDFDF